MNNLIKETDSYQLKVLKIVCIFMIGLTLSVVTTTMVVFLAMIVSNPFAVIVGIIMVIGIIITALFYYVAMAEFLELG